MDPMICLLFLKLIGLWLSKSNGYFIIFKIFLGDKLIYLGLNLFLLIYLWMMFYSYAIFYNVNCVSYQSNTWVFDCIEKKNKEAW
jgi:hypothetical protein